MGDGKIVVVVGDGGKSAESRETVGGVMVNIVDIVSGVEYGEKQRGKSIRIDNIYIRFPSFSFVVSNKGLREM